MNWQKFADYLTRLCAVGELGDALHAVERVIDSASDDEKSSIGERAWLCFYDAQNLPSECIRF